MDVSQKREKIHGTPEHRLPMQSLLTRLQERAGLGLALAMALLVGAGLLLALRDGDRVKSLDELAFLDLSANLAAHRVFAHTNRPDIAGFDPHSRVGELRTTAYRAPGYVWLQVPFRWLGGGPATLRVVNSLLLGLTLCLLFSLLVRSCGRTAGLLGIGLVLLYPVLLYAAGTLYPQTLAALLLMTAIWLVDRLGRDSTPWRFGLVGVTLGALALTVPVDLALVPILGGWMLLARRATPGQVLVMLLALGVTVVPWVARNRHVLQAPVGIATSSGFNLLAGNGPYVRHDQSTGDQRWPKGVREQVEGKGEAERDRLLKEAAIRWIQENPAEASGLFLKKFGYWFAFRNALASDRLVAGGSGAGPPWLRDLAMGLGYGLLLGVLAARLALVRRFPISALEALLLLLYLGAGLVYAVYFTRIRFRLPFDWLLIAVDSLFLARVLGRVVPSAPAKGDRQEPAALGAGAAPV